MSRPVFVFGRPRSGITWLANQLCEHPLIAGIQHGRHHWVARERLLQLHPGALRRLG